MNNGRLAYDPNRLPWLPNERRPPPPIPEPRRRHRGKTVPWATVVPWALLALLLLAGVSYWVGMRSTREATVREPAAQAPAPGASITLPEPREPEPMRAPPIEAAPVVETPEAAPEPAAPVRAAERPRPQPAVAKRPAPTKAKAAPSRPARPKAVARSEPRPRQLQPWPATTSQGASGRMVRIGTFRTSHQAKRAWWQLMRAYPGMQRLKAVVVPVRSLRNNQTYYRLQFGTTSQAHSAVLCQRMRMIGQPCVVIG